VPVASSEKPHPYAPDVVRTDGCPDGMVRVDGEYCPDVDQRCEKHHPEWEKDHAVSERCLAFESPTRCLSKERKHLSFCMDRHEYPNTEGELPWVLTSWRQAVKLCEKDGKRLCTEDEFNFACEGPEMLPHVYGFSRDASLCNIDKPYRKREKKLRTYEKCLADPRCKAELERLDQRHEIGDLRSCIAWSGAYDLNGNVNEWVELPGKKIPDRSGLKGGWWGPVRNRCRPTVTFHKEEDYGYEAGFRCCKDAHAE
jgi:formylglycine-generating enzyme